MQFASAKEYRESYFTVPFKVLLYPSLIVKNPENILTLSFLLEVDVVAYLLFKKLQKPCHCFVTRTGRTTFFSFME